MSLVWSSGSASLAATSDVLHIASAGQDSSWNVAYIRQRDDGTLVEAALWEATTGGFSTWVKQDAAPLHSLDACKAYLTAIAMLEGLSQMAERS